MNANLSREQLLCLQLLGYKHGEILKANIAFFNEVIEMQKYAENMLDKATLLLNKQKEAGIYTLPFYHSDFPDAFREIGDDCPPLIHLLGNAELLKCNAHVAIIGSRQADKKGCEVAYKYGAECAGKGNVIVSGLALGCDTAAHQGCLAVKGKTIAIVASGLNITHPKENKPLQDLILQSGGLLLSEQVIGVKANPTRLIARNRLQFALSQKVIVTQCPIQSGTMHTARLAQKYGKELYAVRFGMYNTNSSGNEYLIKEHLALVL